jgi:hypothetical protein
VISTEEMRFPLGIVGERQWFVLLGEGEEGEEFVDADGDSVVWVPLGCMGDSSSLREVEEGMATFLGGVGGKPGEDDVSGRVLQLALDDLGYLN